MHRDPAIPAPPMAPQRPHAVASPHGTRDDPWFWLRDDDRQQAEVLAYLRAENDYKAAQQRHVQPLEEQLFGEIVARIKQDDATVPYRKNGWWYYARHETGKEYPIYARRLGTRDGPEQVLLDVNALAAPHAYYQVGDFAVSPNNRLLAWTEDKVGRRQHVLRFCNLETGEVYADEIAGVDADIAWADDNLTVLYVEQDPVTLLGIRVRRHLIGTHASADPLLYEQEDPSFYLQVKRSKSDRYLFIVSESTVASEVRYAAAADPELRFSVVLPRARDHEYQVEHVDERFIIRTNFEAADFRIVEVPVAACGDLSRWRDVVPAEPGTFIEDYTVFKDWIAVNMRSGGLLKIFVRRWTESTGSFLTAGEPAYAMFLGANAELDSGTLRYVYSSLVTPATTYDYEFATGTWTVLKREPVLGGFDAANYRSEFLWAPAADGSSIPVSLLYRVGFERNGTAPLYQYAYGAYGHSTDPTFRSTILSLVDRGYVYAIAHVRGGQELGRRWYDAGRLLHKKNTFTDFVAVTRFLVDQRYAAPDKVVAMGASAGGLLIGAVANLAPQQYRALVAHVPFVDIVTTMLDESLPLTVNEFDEWGNPAEASYYTYMLSYSPYDNVSRQDYPALLVTTGLWDSQVQYWEPAKWVARLRALKTDTRPLLFRTNMEAGHGGKSGRFQRYREIAEEFAFLIDQIES